MNNHAWKTESHKTEKPWGYEISWAALPQIHGKILHINAGHKTSFKYNVVKNEALFVMSGKVEITYGQEKSKIDSIAYPFKVKFFLPGDVLNIQPGAPYRIRAIEDSEIIEIGNMQSSPIVRVVDDYDRVTKEESWAKDL
jgi:mannose-6-phosphate isomerase